METAELLTWRKSSYSTSNGGNCIEVATTVRTIAVRDSKNPAGIVLTVNFESWRAFIQDTKSKNYARG
ncbi:MAG TPA: DUF397 domain-containing protein [Trebonia sp.]|jgi:hypothetical protein|nr:DUF397 domain-containing protein [Trebonia sp.]